MDALLLIMPEDEGHDVIIRGKDKFAKIMESHGLSLDDICAVEYKDNCIEVLYKSKTN